VLDVGDHPRLADLLLAADAAVLDYGPLRFDAAVAGLPMLFHVPDLERARADGGWLVDHDATAPGPQLRTAAEVAERLGDLPAVRAEHAAAYAAFRAAFLSLEDGHAAARLVDAVFVPRGDA
jgi:CDP-glycerol glycerophosphotransferase